MNCGKGNRLNARFCDGCGTKLIDREIDPVCELFVGREKELNSITQAINDASSGRGRIVLLSGEAGIGKTSTAEIAIELSTSSGFKAYSCYCHEAAGAPPFWPWIQLLRSWLDNCSVEEIEALPVESIGPIAELLPELLSKLAKQPSEEIYTNDEAARFKLFDSVTNLWLSSSQSQPLMLVFDDLQWADASSLKLLEFFAREVEKRAVLLVVTFRENEITRTHPLSDILGGLSRCLGTLRLELSGLNLLEASQYFAIVTGESLSPTTVTNIHDRTEGNPLFLAEMARYLKNESSNNISFKYQKTDPLPLPKGIREIIGRRLNQVSADCNEMLKLAAVIGRCFELSVLKKLCMGTLLDSEIEVLVKEGVKAYVLIDSHGFEQYQFSHALIRDTLYREIPLSKQAALHLEIANILECSLTGSSDQNVIPLAYHYAASLPSGDQQKALAFSELAGSQADKMLAFEEAAEFYQTALSLLDSKPSVTHFRLNIVMGESLLNAGESLKALHAFRQAIDIASKLELSSDLARATVMYEEACWRPGLPGHVAVRLLKTAYAGLDSSESLLQVQVLASLTRALIFTGDLEEAHRVNIKAERMARDLGDPSSLVFVLLSGLAARWGPERLTSRLAAAREAIDLATELGDVKRRVDLAGWYMFDLLEAGDVVAAFKAFELQNHLAHQLHQPYWLYVGKLFRATLALFNGEMKASENLAMEAMETGGQLIGQDVAGVFGLQIFNLRREQGRLHEVEPILTEFMKNAPSESTWRPGLAILFTELDKKELAQKEFKAMSEDGFSCIPRDALWPGCLTYLTEVCVYLRDQEKAAELHKLLLPHDGFNIVVGACTACHGAASRLLGMLENVMKRWDEAARHFESAIQMNARQGARPWLAHSQFEYAKMLSERGAEDDKAKSLKLLASALDTANDIGMKGLIASITNLNSKITGSSTKINNAKGLSKREIEVLQLVAKGKSNKEIARELYRSENTIANHIHNILEKTGSANRAEAVAFSVRNEITLD
ncbi:helix-turn-helix transcriptional regulator [Neptuniibacter sp. PT8_73]|uniref:helix-turn-helix transcriptional regulator n=1 Tax=Neptuniibacter sp. PT8_73 TaxID=3398206 RepID=UPI0039F4A287